MELTKRERRKLRLEKLRQESHEAQKEYEQRLSHEAHRQNHKPKFYAIAAVIVAIMSAIAFYSIYSISKPGPYDSFAKCLSEKGAVMYGAMGWCKYTQAQKAMFGKSFRYIAYHEFNELPGIRKTPTWVINGQWYENVQSFDKLATLTGCSLA